MSPSEASSASIRRLIAEIRADRKALLDRCTEVARYSDNEPQSTEERTAALALALDRSYTALEAILERIARVLEGGPPTGPAWHRTLLDNAGLEIDRVRPAILSTNAVQAASKLRSLRHFLRHAYHADLDVEQLQNTASSWLSVSIQLQSDLDSFETFLSHIADRLNS